MSILDWFKNLGKPEDTRSMPKIKITSEELLNEEERKKQIKEIEITLNLLEEEARVIYRR